VDDNILAKAEEALNEELESKIIKTGLPRKEISGDKFTGHLIVAMGELPPMREGKNNKRIVCMSKKDVERDTLILHPNPEVRNLMAARMALKSLTLHLGRIRSLRAYARSRNWFFAAPIGYYNAWTGRFGGIGGVNIQNLPGDKTKNEAAQLIRTAIVPLPGQEFYNPDYSRIEAVCVAWETGQDDLVEEFRKGADVYSSFATRQYGEKVWKPDKDTDSPEIYSKMKLRRGCGKTCILGLGFGMGEDGLLVRLQLDLGVDNVTPDMATKGWGTYQKLYPRIREGRKELERACKLAYENPGVMFSACKCSVWYDKGTLFNMLPSSRVLFYPQCTLVKDGRYETLMSGGAKLWAGALIENATQAIARDILVEKILTLDAKGYTIAYHTHDCVGLPCTKGTAEDFGKKVSDILVEPPTWGLDLPLAIDAKTIMHFD
jgi:DNA polymerase